MMRSERADLGLERQTLIGEQPSGLDRAVGQHTWRKPYGAFGHGETNGWTSFTVHS